MGEPPLPPFIRRPAEPEDTERFQTIYAKYEGAVTVPAAGLHFSRELMKRMEIKGINLAFITMHCGLGCFRDIDVEGPDQAQDGFGTNVHQIRGLPYCK